MTQAAVRIDSSAAGPDKAAVRKVLDGVKADGRTSLTAPEGKLVCDAYGIPVPQEGVAGSAAEAAKLAGGMGFPVVMKIVSPDILHKTEAGGVALNLGNRDAVLKAADALIASAKAAYPNAKIDGFLVQEMASGIEAIVGARSDKLYGPMLLVGAGGILVELAKDAALRMLPVSKTDVTAMVDGLKLNKLIAGYRGKGAADRAALEKTVLALAEFYLDHRARIDDIEINPLMVRPDGKGAIAVDVRVIWRDSK
jgi:acyl-CoA synthetase (NDP forming)